MVATLYLCSNDFELKQEDDVIKMCTKIPGMSMICFYSTQCEHCADLVPVFKKLPLMHQGCQFGIINVGKRINHNIINASQQTNTPLTHVPFIIIYIDGSPHMKFDDDPTPDNLIKFINHVADEKKQTLSFTKDKKTIGTYGMYDPNRICHVRVCDLKSSES